jgi:hypothetical protein
MHLSVKFRRSDRRAYTYTYDGDHPIAPGDQVKIDTRDGIKTVEVVAINLPKPSFACKPILSVLTEGGV